MITLKNLFKSKFRFPLTCLISRQYQYKSGEINPQKDVLYPFEGDKQFNEIANKKAFISPIKKKQKKSLQRKEFIEYQKQLKEKADTQLSGKQKSKQSQLEDDDLWGKEGLPKRIYDKITGKELNWLSRPQDYYEKNDRKINYLQEFQKPFTIHDNEIRKLIDQIKQKCASTIQNPDPNNIVEQVYKNDKEVMTWLEDLKNRVNKVNYKLLPSFGLALSLELRYKQDVAKIWESYVEEVLKNIHHYTPIELAKIRYATAGTFPKAGSPSFHKSILDILSNELPLCNTGELLHIFHAFRTLNTNKIQSKLVNVILSRKSELIKDPEGIANFLYTYANCRLSKKQRKNQKDIEADQKELKNIMEQFYQPIMDSIEKMSINSLIRLSLGLNLLRVMDYQDILLRIERFALKQVDKFDAFQTANLIYSFSKTNNGQALGSKNFYEKFSTLVDKFWNQFNNLEKSRIFYAYTTRLLLSSAQFEKLYINWIKQNMKQFNHQELQNVALGLMFQEVTDKTLWVDFVHNVAKHKQVVPLSNYYALKLARYYLDLYFPKWNYQPYEDSCKFAEDAFNTLRVKKQQVSQEYIELSQILRNKLNIDSKAMVEWDNLFVIDFAIMPQQVAILIQNDRNSQPDSTLATPLHKLKCKILEGNDWKVVSVNWEEFKRLGEKKIDWLKSEVQKSFEEQDVKYKGKEGFRWGRLFKKMEDIGERATMEADMQSTKGDIKIKL